MPGPGVRPLIEEAYRDAGPGRVVAAVAPTSYGKTVASPELWRRAREDGLAAGLIHVAPLRSLVGRVYQDLFKPLGGRLQMHGAPAGERSPYFLSSLVVSTLDSFLWNLYRIPVAEALKVERGYSMGHYYPALLSIYTSLVVLDEGHLYLWEEPSPGETASSISAAAAAAAVAGLAWAGVPTLVETATASPAMLSELRRAVGSARGRLSVKALKAPRAAGGCPYLEEATRAAGSTGVGVVEDPDWEAGHLTPWLTLLAGSWDEVLSEIVDDASRGPVLVVANTVEEAVELHDRLEGRVGRAVLVHGRLSEEDRSRAEEGIREVEERGGVVVATQVAEAGVDVNALAVYTAAAPLESLAQRAGRACRRGGILAECMQSGGKLVVVTDAKRGPYDPEAVEEGVRLVAEAAESDRGALDWRATCNHGSRVSYASLLARAGAAGRGSPGAAGLLSLFKNLLKMYLHSDARPWVLLDLLDKAGLCSLARDSALVEVDVGGSSVPVSLHWALRHAEEALEMGGAGPVVVVEWRYGGQGGVVEAEAWRLWRAWRGSRERGGCRSLINALMQDAVEALKGVRARAPAFTVRLKAKRGAYRRGRGLLA
ncbi:helicase-related protein [Stetteria hydrogenophila]